MLKTFLLIITCPNSSKQQICFRNHWKTCSKVKGRIALFQTLSSRGLMIRPWSLTFLDLFSKEKAFSRCVWWKAWDYTNSINSQAQMQSCSASLTFRMWWRITRTQFKMEVWENVEDGFGKLLAEVRDADLKSYGILANSFYELEPGYADHYRNLLNKRAWCIGPVSNCIRNVEEKGARGRGAAIGNDKCLNWLDGKQSDSVVYVCFGSGCRRAASLMRSYGILHWSTLRKMGLLTSICINYLIIWSQEEKPDD